MWTLSCPLCPLHPQFAQWMLSAHEARGCEDLFQFMLHFIRSVSVSSQCKTVTSSGEMISQKASLKLTQLWSWKVFTHLAVRSLDVIISHCVWAQFSSPLPVNVHFYFLPRQADRQAEGQAYLDLYSVQHNFARQATNLSKEKEKIHLLKAAFLLVPFRVYLAMGEEESMSMNPNSSSVFDFPLQHLSCSTSRNTSPHFLVLEPQLLPTPASKTALTSRSGHAARAQGTWSEEHLKRTFGVKQARVRVWAPGTETSSHWGTKMFSWPVSFLADARRHQNLGWLRLGNWAHSDWVCSFPPVLHIVCRQRLCL